MAEPDQEDFKEKIKTVQVPRQPHVEQKSASGSTQTHHTSGRVDANIMAETVYATMKMTPPGSDESGAEK